jgi:two-component system response regulator (stage 0 sporulation protein F)
MSTTKSNATGGRVAPKKLLVIDDEPNFTMMMVEFFKTHGYDVRSAATLDDAINAFKRMRPKVVLLDFNMPLVNGDKLLPLLQDLDPSVRVIVVSGYGEEEVEEKFRGLGYFAFFEKGTLSLERVRDKVDEALGY